MTTWTNRSEGCGSSIVTQSTISTLSWTYTMFTRSTNYIIVVDTRLCTIHDDDLRQTTARRQTPIHEAQRPFFASSSFIDPFLINFHLARL